MTNPAREIIARLGLDSAKIRQWRLVWIRNVELAKQYDPDHYERLLRYPDDMPDLSRLAPESNSKPGGVHESFFARRSRAEMPEYYLD